MRPPSIAVHTSSWRSVVLANTLGSRSRWASSLLTDRLQYRDAAKAGGEIRATTISTRINFSRDTAPGSEPGAAQTHHHIQFPGQIHDCTALVMPEKVSGDGTFSLMDVEGWFSGMAWQGQTSQDEFWTGSCPKTVLGLELKFLHWCFPRAVKHLKLSSILGKIPFKSHGIPPSFERIHRKKPSKDQCSLLLVMSPRALAPLLS